MAETGVVLPFVTRPFVPALAPVARRDLGTPSLGILVIDADPDNRTAIRLSLETKGFILNEAADGETGIRLAQALAPDCVLLAGHLPDMTGGDALERLRRPDGRLPCAIMMLAGPGGTDPGGVGPHETPGPPAAATAPPRIGAIEVLTHRHLTEDSLRWAVRGAIERFWLIEERHRADERHGQLAALVAASPDGIVSVGFDFLIRTWNPGAAGMFGHAEAEAIGRDIRELIIPPDLRAGVANLHDAVRAGQQTLLLETERLHRDGHRVAVEANGAPMLDAAGQATGVSIIFREIGARKAAESRLRDSEAFNRELVEASPDCLKVIDPEGRLEFMNRRGLELLDIEDFAPLAATPWESLWPEESRPTIRNAVAAAAKGDQSRFEAFCPTAKGQPKWWDVAVRPVLDPGGRLLRILSTSRDITARRADTEALRRETARQRLLLDLTHALLGADLDEAGLGGLVFATLSTAFGADACLHYRFDPARKRLELVFERGVPPESRAAADFLDLGQSFCGAVVETREAMMADAARIAADPRGVFARSMGMRAYACCPIMAVDGRILGTFSLGSTTRDGFSPEEATFLRTVTNFLSQAWERLDRERELRDSERRLRQTREAGGLGLWEWRADADGAMRFEGVWENLWPGGGAFTRDEWLERVFPDDRERAAATLRHALRPGHRHDEECRMRHPDGTFRWLHWTGEADAGGTDPGGPNPGGPNPGEPNPGGTNGATVLRGIVLDITERKRAEQRQQMLMQELAHRGRNLLAVIQSIVLRGLSSARTIEEAKDSLNGRIQALARTYGTITNGAFQGAPLDEILANELSPFGVRVHLEGPKVMLHAKASQTFALIAHELATNATKHGALSVPDGQIHATWRVDGGERAERFHFEWRETGGPPVTPPLRRGFGTTLASRVAGAEFACEPALFYPPKGFCYNFDAPMERMGAVMHDSLIRDKLESDHVRALFDAWERQRGPDGALPRYARFVGGASPACRC